MKKLNVLSPFLLLLVFWSQILTSQNDCIEVYNDTDIERSRITGVQYFNDTLYISSFKGGFYKFSSGSFDSISYFNSSLPDVGVMDMSVFNQKLALAYRSIGHAYLYFYDIQTGDFEEIISVEEMSLLNGSWSGPGPHFIMSIESTEDLLLVGTSSGLLIMDTLDNMTLYTSLDSNESTDYVRDIEKDEQGNLWLGTSSGCFRFDPEELTFNLLSGTQDYEIRSLLTIDNQDVLFMTSDGDFYRYIDEEIVEVYIGLPSNSWLTADIKIYNDSVFIARGRDLYFFDKNTSDLHQFFSTAGTSICLDTDGERLAIGTTEELIIYNCGDSLNSIDDEELNKLKHEIEIFPNPIREFLIIKYEGANFNANNISVDISDGIGRKVIHNNISLSINDDEVTVDMSKIPPGNYYIIMSMFDQQIIEKVIKI